MCLLQASSCIEVLQLNYLAVVLKYPLLVERPRFVRFVLGDAQNNRLVRAVCLDAWTGASVAGSYLARGVCGAVLHSCVRRWIKLEEELFLHQDIRVAGHQHMAVDECNSDGL